jgi:hypothetical protein
MNQQKVTDPMSQTKKKSKETFIEKLFLSIDRKKKKLFAI